MKHTWRAWRAALPVLLLVVMFAGCGQRAASQPTIKVGSKDFTEEFILAEMYALLLEDAGFKAERKFNLGGTPVAHAALQKGDIDLYPEYTSTGLLTILKQSPMSDPTAVLEAVRKGYKEQFQLE